MGAPDARLSSLHRARDARPREQPGGGARPRALPAHGPPPAHPARAAALPGPARAAPGAGAVANGARRRAGDRRDGRRFRGGRADRERAVARAVGAVPHGDRRVRGGSRAGASHRPGDRGPGALVSAAAVAVRGLRCAYPGTARPALADLDLELTRSALAVVMGASGAGKSTLARCLTRLVPCFVPAEVTGDIRLLGAPIHERRV
ncbi:MAG: ATP-binding cassette domain-containing protein, partial [Deltaproteobacteria bacterium]